jgi:hypothetical protein
MREKDSYGADKVLVGCWVALVGAPLPIWIYDALKQGGTQGLATPLVVSLALPLALLIFTSRFRVTFEPNHLVYRRWGPTLRVAYDDIASIQVANRTRISGDAIGAFIVTRAGERLPFWPKLFPRPAVTRFFQLAQGGRRV